MAQGICSVEGCERLAYIRGWCGRHYQKVRKFGVPVAGYEREVRPPPSTCSIAECVRVAHSQGLCISHYKRVERHGDPFAGASERDHRPLEVRYLDLLEPQANGCILWTGFVNSQGYPWARTNGRSLLVHRYIYKHFVGPIPRGLVIDHACHNRDPFCHPGACPHRACLNLEHLEAVTQGENQRRAFARRRL